MINIKINEYQGGVKLDKFLFSKYSNINMADLRKFIRNKEIRVNDKRVDANYSLRENDLINFSEFIGKILENPVNIRDNDKIDVKYNKLITDNIIFENDNSLVINKPYGLSVQGGTGVNISVDKIIKNLSRDENYKLVHRLDRDTTGVLLIAKNIETSNKLIEIFKSKNNIKKEYLAVVHGKIRNKSGVINYPLLKKYEREEERNIEKVYVDKNKGKEAITKYEVLSYSEKCNISFVKIEILTGRTHQIRAHFKEIGHPIIGDFKYGKKEYNKLSRQLLLHSHKIYLKLFGEKFEFVADLPKHIKDVIGENLLKLLY